MALSLQALARLPQELGCVNVKGEGAAGTPLDELVSVDTNSGLQGSGRMSFLSLIHFLVLNRKRDSSLPPLGAACSNHEPYQCSPPVPISVSLL